MEGYREVEEVRGIRLLVEDDTPHIEYLVKWKVCVCVCVCVCFCCCGGGACAQEQVPMPLHAADQGL